MFCCTLFYVHSSIAFILKVKRELVALLNLSSWCLVMVEWLFLAVPRGCLWFLIVVFPDHTHLLFSKDIRSSVGKIACNDRNAFFTSEKPKKYHAWSCQNVCDTLTFLLDNIFIRFGTKLYRQVVGIPMGTNCAPLVADLFLFCYERDFMISLSDDKQTDVIDGLTLLPDIWTIF